MRRSARPRRISAVIDGKTVGEYIYDSKGRRVIKKTGPASANSSSAQNTVYHYDIVGRLIEETAGNGKLLVDYVFLNSAPLAIIRKQNGGDEIFYYHNDHLGAPKVITDKLKKVVWNIDLDPFGNEVPVNGRKGGYIRNVENNLRFPGQYYDAETGLHYNMLRDYSPKLGRYLEADPIGLYGGMNLYNYVGGNPVNAIDPTGTISPGKAWLTKSYWLGFADFAAQRGFTVVADLMRYSLNNLPKSPLVRRVNQGPAMQKIPTSSEYKALRMAMIKYFKDKVKPGEVYRDEKWGDGIIFSLYTDLGLAIHRAEIDYSGEKYCDGSFELTIHIFDKYDYDDSTIANISTLYLNHNAYEAQEAGIIHKFFSDFYFEEYQQ